MIVYKAVRQVRGKLKSIVPRRHSGKCIANLTYAKGKTTKPIFGKVFAFDNMEAAIEFVGMRPHPQIWLAEAPDKTKIETIASDSHSMCLARFKRFWEGKESSDSMAAPSGTVVCSEITLVKKVWE